ncbi:GNAT family N-acetyltransferase [Albibacterium profundi]|uniref:GNAT family N-acetyltransferase n=1 Tax=Albibacterium profundi TaxID=3134906 RepID=A0ABV5C9Y9_9SPHI
MIEIKEFNKNNQLTASEKQQIISFLYKSLEQYGDPESSIEKAINYALGEQGSLGGHVLTANLHGNLCGVVVINKTGMDEYIPANILVYIATDKEHRGKGIGKELMQKAIETTTGDIALHVEPDNPAKKLYERLGFTNKYLEMRLVKEDQ